MALSLTKNRSNRLLGLGAVALGALMGGCATSASGPWVWRAPEPRPFVADPGGADTHDASVLVFSRSGFFADARAETTRRDDTLSARTTDALPNRLAWPEADRPSLDRRRSYTTSRNAERWVYPSDRRDRRFYSRYRR